MTKPVLGIDIGGTNIKSGLVLGSGDIHHLHTFKTQDFHSPEELLRELRKRYPMPLTGVGIGAPNINQESGVIENPPNLSWAPRPLPPLFKAAFKAPVQVANDANALTLAVQRWGEGCDYAHFICLSLGTGVGSGMVIHGKLLDHQQGRACEVGHLPVASPAPRPCGCGGEAHLESYLGAQGILQTHQELGGGRVASVAELAQWAQSGDPIARETFHRAGYALGEALAVLMNTITPECFILTGGISRSFQWMEKACWERALSLCFRPFRPLLKICTSQLDPSSIGVLGASAAFLRRQ